MNTNFPQCLNEMEVKCTAIGLNYLLVSLLIYIYLEISPNRLQICNSHILKCAKNMCCDYSITG